MRNGTVTQSLKYMADAQTQLFKVLLRQWEQCSMWGSCWGRGQWKKEERTHLSLKMRKEDVYTAAGPSVREDIVELGLG